MKYSVIDAFRIGDGTSVTIKGNGNGLESGMLIHDEYGTAYIVKSIAMDQRKIPEDIEKSTTLLIQGEFSSKEIRV